MKKITIFFIIISTLLASKGWTKTNKNWYTSNSSYNSLRYSELSNINLDNAKNLKLNWIYKNGYLPPKSSRTNNQATPIYTGKYLITTSLDNYLISLDPELGKEIWRTKLPGPVAKRGMSFKNLKKISTRAIFVTTRNGVFAINEANGKIINNIGNEGKFGETLSLVPPIINDDSIIVASLHKKVTKFNLMDGEILWDFNHGSRVWSGFSYNSETNTVGFVTGNHSHDLIFAKPSKEILSNSLVLLDEENGSLKCKFQDVLNDHWDLDMVSPPIFINDNLNENKLNVVWAFGKTGNIIVVDLDKCELFFEESLKQIKVNDETNILNSEYSEIQNIYTLPEKVSEIKYEKEKYLNYLNNDFEKKFIEHKLRNSKHDTSYIPLSTDYDVVMMNIHGGPSWTGGTYDKHNKQVILPIINTPWFIRTFYKDRLFNKLNYYKTKYLPNNDKKKSNIYLSPWEKNLNSQNNLISKSYKFYSSFFDGYDIYLSKCSSCHGVARQGYRDSEKIGDKFIPSLANIDKTFRKNSMMNLEKFVNSHKYVGDMKIDVTKDELEKIYSYMKNFDKIHNKFNLYKAAGKWGLFLDSNKLPASVPPWGEIVSLKISNGKINWRKPFGEKKIGNKVIQGDINFGGIISTGGGIFVATGTPDKKVRIFNSSNGQKLWEYEMDYSGSSHPMTFEHNGDQYIIVNASGGRFFGYEKKIGDQIYSFKLN